MNVLLYKISFSYFKLLADCKTNYYDRINFEFSYLALQISSISLSTETISLEFNYCFIC